MSLSTALSPACAQRGGGLAKWRLPQTVMRGTNVRFRTTFSAGFRRHYAKPLVVSNAFCPFCRVVSLSTRLTTFRTASFSISQLSENKLVQFIFFT